MEQSVDEHNNQLALHDSMQQSSPPETPPSPAASSQLEKVLSDTDMPCLKRLKKATWIELKLLFKLAAPAVMMYLINNAMSISTRIFSGHLGNREFAAACLGNQGIQLFAYGLLVTRNGKRGRNALRTGVRRAAVRNARRLPPTRHRGPVSVQHPDRGGVRAVEAAPPLYRRIGTGGDTGVGVRVRPDPAGIRVRREFPDSEIYAVAEHSGAERVDITRDAWSAFGGELDRGFVYIVRSEKCKDTWTGFKWEALTGLWEFVKLSIASAVMLCLETWYFQVLVLVAGLLDNPELSLDALSVCMSVSGLMFMVAIGFNAAASVRVGNEIGAGHPKSAALSVVVVTLVSFTVAAVEATVVLSQRHVISYIFTGGETVANAVAELCPFLAVTLLLNGIQPVLSGVAVGCGWQAFVAYVNIGCYYVVGIPIGCILGFKFNLGVKGIWSGMIGGTAMQTLILIWVTFRTDWNKEVEKARMRLDKWEEIKEPLLKH
ncbi:hypothetical protein DH2020_017286 [Rehmannia glutinosa]|uniref:Protein DETOXIFICATION n=1 Tax=Rehmannia glutinosa TaxID=99300 RepID=A0ABR0WT55_REHGL